MKRLLFLIASAFIATAGYCSTVSNEVISKITKSDPIVQLQSAKQLTLEKASSLIAKAAWHSSHSSHSSHASHSSHSSHYSSR